MLSRSLFLFPVYKRHFVVYGDHYLSVSDAQSTTLNPWKCRYSRWNFTNMLFLSEAMSISSLQAPFCCFPVIIIYLRRSYILWIGRLRKYRYSRWNFPNMSLLFPVLGAILNFRMSVHDNASAYPGYIQLWTKHVYDTKTYVFSMDVAHFWGTFSDHTFPSIFKIYSAAILHFRWRVTSRNHFQAFFFMCVCHMVIKDLLTYLLTMPTAYSGQVRMKIWK